MNRTQLEYDIVDAESIVGHGDITNITDKRKRSWNLFSIESFFIFSLRFRQPSIIQLIELKGHNTYLVELSMFNDARHLLGVKSFQLKRKD